MKAFLAVERTRSIRAAAVALKLPLNTLRYRLDRLERQLGAPLFRRTHAGSTLTGAGEDMRVIALAMSQAAVRGLGTDKEVLVRKGQITISCSEGLGAIWLTPLIDELRASLPHLTVGLLCSNDLTRDHDDVADLGITFRMPANQDLIAARLGTLHFLCFASSDYLRRNGTPQSFEDLANHTFIEQDAPGMSPGIRAHLVGPVEDESFVYLRTNSSFTLYYAVVTGAGIAAMPTYCAAVSRRLKPLDLGAPLHFPFYYCYHRAARHSSAVRTAIDWLKRSFDPIRYPFFAERYVHPTELEPLMEGKVIPLFRRLAE